MKEQMSIREMLFKDFGVDLPISGGWGNSLENAVLVEYHVPNDYVSVEYAYLKFLGFGRRIEWRVIRQELIQKDGKSYDKIKIETTQVDSDNIIKQIENYYFDISDCFDRK